MLEAFFAVSVTGMPIGIHAENYAICDYYVNKLKKQGRMDAPAWAEALMILAEKAIQELGRSSFAKIAPPLRRKEDNDLLWTGLVDGSVDFVATDHAPYEIATEKAAPGMDIWTSFPGIPGVETMVPVMVNEGYNKGKISLSRLVEVLCKNPAVHYGLYPKKGTLEVGADADFTIIDLDKEWTVDQELMHCKPKYTPFHGMKLKGKVDKTIVRGNLIYDDAEGIVAKPGVGQYVKRQTISELPRVGQFFWPYGFHFTLGTRIRNKCYSHLPA